MQNRSIPSLGRVVLFKSQSPELTGGCLEVPAIITRVWSDTCVNLMVMRDGHGATPIGVTSVSYADDFAAVGHSNAWRWPPYQPPAAAGVKPVNPVRPSLAYA